MTSPDAPPTTTAKRAAPSLLIALFLSLFASGAGQFYLGRLRAALVWLGLATIGVVLANAIFPALSNAGLFIPGVAIFLFLTMARLFSALDTLRGSKVGADRPSIAVVAIAFFASLSLTIAASLFARAYLVEAYKIPAGSMMPTLLVGDHLFVDKKAKAFQRGHLSVFAYPENPNQDFVKRVVGVGGDRIEIREGELFINEWAVPHCKVGHGTLPQVQDEPTTQGTVFVEFLDDQAYLTIRTDLSGAAREGGPWKVNAGECFVRGDNRENSHDSRYWFGGAGGSVPANNAKGEPFVIWLAVDDHGFDKSRIGAATSTPTLPATMSELAPALTKCLVARPPLEATTPPP
jgi:signal peptidase I